MTRVLLVGLAMVASACAAPVAPSERLPEGAELVARFGEARALGTDGAGRLYVVDGAASEVIVMDVRGAVHDRLGGTDEQAFLDVTDVDPTNGQAVFVADAGTGRLVRFTEEGRAAEILEVPRLRDLDPTDRAGEGLGRPVAVAAGPGDTLYAIEAERGVVLRWDADRTLERVLGGPASPMPLRAPSALTVRDDGALLVADGDRVVVFDAFGALEEVQPLPSLGRVQSVAVGERSVLAVGPTAVVRLDGGERIPIDLGEALVGVAGVGSHVYVLTATRLVRVPLASPAW